MIKGKAMEGVVPILLTPFDRTGREIDYDSLRSLIDFNLEADVAGLGVALGSEVFKLTETERAAIVRAVVEHVAGRVPVVVNSGASGTDLAIHYSRMAAEAGADYLMLIPPHFMPATAAEVVDYYVAIARAVDLPIIIQDVPQSPVPPALALQIAELTGSARSIKVESLPVVARVSAMTEAASDELTIFGGAGGTYFIEEMRRGARGTMPFPSQPADFIEVWRLFQAGDEAGARRVFDSTIMAVNRLAGQAGDLAFHVHKQMLVRKGIIENAVVRSPTMAIDLTTQREIDVVLAAL